MVASLFGFDLPRPRRRRLEMLDVLQIWWFWWDLMGYSQPINIIFGSIWDLIEVQRHRKTPGFGLNLVHLGTLKVVSYSAWCGEFWGWLVETYDVSAFVSGRILTYSHMAIEHPRWLMLNFTNHDIKVVVPWRETEKMEMPAANWVPWIPDAYPWLRTWGSSPKK